MFEPVNRYILIDIPKPVEESASLAIILPDDYKTPESFIGFSAEVRLRCQV